MNPILTFARKPFPREESFGAAVKIITAISLFVAVFLYVFRPFGLHSVDQHYLLLCLGFGATTFVVSVVYDALVTKRMLCCSTPIRCSTSATLGQCTPSWSKAICLIVPRWMACWNA